MTTNERTGVAGAMPEEQEYTEIVRKRSTGPDYQDLETVRHLKERGGEVNVGEVLAALAWALENMKLAWSLEQDWREMYYQGEHRLKETVEELEKQKQTEMPVYKIQCTPDQLREALRRYKMGFNYTPSPSDEEFDKDYESKGESE